MAEGVAGSAWGRWDGRCVQCVRLVLAAAADARAAAAAAGVCRAWRAAAADPRVWRAALRARGVSDTAMRAAAAASADSAEGNNVLGVAANADWWRSECVLSAAGWAARGAAPAACAQHAALSGCQRRLALAHHEGEVTVWSCEPSDEYPCDEWSASCGWRVQLRTRPGGDDWASAVRVEWAPGGRDRILAVGALALSPRWELAVVCARSGRRLARAACGAGGAGCWVTADAFLSLELRRAAPRHYTTAVWLNAATQEAQDEQAGVATPLLRVYNEAQTNISHVLIAETEPEYSPPETTADDDQETCVAEMPPGVAYYRATSEKCRVAAGAGSRDTVMVCAVGVRGGEGGSASALAAWRLAARAPAEVRASAGGDLRERRARWLAREAEEPAPEPGEAAVRALCSPPRAARRLGAPVAGLATAPRGRALWAITAGGAAHCLALPTLTALCRLLPPADGPRDLTLHYVQPSVSDDIIASPLPGGGGGVWVRTRRLLARGRPPRPAPAPAEAALLRHAKGGARELLVLAGGMLYIWESKAPAL